MDPVLERNAIVIYVGSPQLSNTWHRGALLESAKLLGLSFPEWLDVLVSEMEALACFLRTQTH